MKLFRTDTQVQDMPAPAAPEAPAQDVKPEAIAQDVPLQPAQDAAEPTAPEDRPPEPVAAEADQPAPPASARVENFEAELRDVIRRDVVRWRGPRPEPAQAQGSAAADNVGSVVQRVSGQSVREIEHVIGELLIVRDVLREEGERLKRDLTGYASMNQAAMSSMKIIGDSMQQWRSTLSKVRRA
jgi:hypothetical protein